MPWPVIRKVLLVEYWFAMVQLIKKQQLLSMKYFFEVLIAPAFEEDALDILKSKKNRILLQQKTNPEMMSNTDRCLMEY